jgi:hypothetical protein
VLIWTTRVLLLAAATLVLAIGAFVGGIIWSSFSDQAERRVLQRPDDANWQYARSLGSAAWEGSNPSTFAGLNSGRWKELCVVGGYNKPTVEFERAFGRMDISDETRRWFSRPFPVEEFDLAIIWRDEMGRIDVLDYVGGGAVETQHLSKCLHRDGAIRP